MSAIGSVWNFIRFGILLGLSFALNMLIMAFASPNFYATMGYENPLQIGVTIGKIILGIVIFGFIIPKSSKKTE